MEKGARDVEGQAAFAQGQLSALPVVALLGDGLENLGHADPGNPYEERGYEYRF
jgi:hypothetical protein